LSIAFFARSQRKILSNMEDEVKTARFSYGSLWLGHCHICLKQFTDYKSDSIKIQLPGIQRTLVHPLPILLICKDSPKCKIGAQKSIAEELRIQKMYPIVPQKTNIKVKSKKTRTVFDGWEPGLCIRETERGFELEVVKWGFDSICDWKQYLLEEIFALNPGLHISVDVLPYLNCDRACLAIANAQKVSQADTMNVVVHHERQNTAKRLKCA
jgi:hypothetical protein